MRRSTYTGIIIAAAAMAAALLGSCKGDNTVNSLDDIVFPDSKISYDRTVQPLFNIACSYTSCHDSRTAAGSLDLTSYSGVLQRSYDVFIPHDTTLSHLVWRIEGKYGLPPMPPTRALTENQRRGLKQWIIEGATDTIR